MGIVFEAEVCQNVYHGDACVAHDCPTTCSESGSASVMNNSFRGEVNLAYLIGDLI